MAFLDNSGDIILDAVLTDTGRARLAKGDGTFRIAKFALGDDEIDYGLYDKNNTSGSAYYDLEILQTPVLEAFTNNTANLNSKLISISRTNLLYLPTVKLNEVATGGGTARNTQINMFYVAVDEDTNDALEGVTGGGVLNGNTGIDGSYIRVDQGLDTLEITPVRELDSDLVETQYLIEIDTRLGGIVDAINTDSDATAATISFIDDDQIANYYLSLGADDGKFVQEITSTVAANNSISGPRGTKLMFRILASLDLNTSEFLFQQFGSTVTNPAGADPGTYLFIDSNIRVTGVTTGSRIDIPVRFIKLSN